MAVTAEDVDAVVAAASTLPSATGVYLETDFVLNLLATVVDYQMHTTTVERALEHFKRERWDQVRTLEALHDVLARFPHNKDGNIELAVWLWGYRLWTRAEQLRGLVTYFDSIGVTDQTALKSWATRSTFKNDFESRVRGLGPAVFNWLVMRQGVETVKPDVMSGALPNACSAAGLMTTMSLKSSAKQPESSG